jgi:hypothetical protein
MGLPLRAIRGSMLPKLSGDRELPLLPSSPFLAPPPAGLALGPPIAEPAPETNTISLLISYGAISQLSLATLSMSALPLQAAFREPPSAKGSICRVSRGSLNFLALKFLQELSITRTSPPTDRSPYEVRRKPSRHQNGLSSSTPARPSGRLQDLTLFKMELVAVALS